MNEASAPDAGTKVQHWPPDLESTPELSSAAYLYALLDAIAVVLKAVPDDALRLVATNIIERIQVDGLPRAMTLAQFAALHKWAPAVSAERCN